MSAFLFRLGLIFRETGQALDRLGCQLAGSPAYREELYRHRPVLDLPSAVSEVAKDSFVAPSAAVSGKTELGSKASVWYGTVVRGDAATIHVGDNTNLQDGVVIASGPTDIEHFSQPTSIGSNVTIGHAASMTGVTIEDECLIGMGATLSRGVKVERGAMVAAGAVVPAGTTIPAGQLWAGNPAKFLRELKPEEKNFLPVSADVYSTLASEHSSEAARPPPF